MIYDGGYSGVLGYDVASPLENDKQCTAIDTLRIKIKFPWGSYKNDYYYTAGLCIIAGDIVSVEYTNVSYGNKRQKMIVIDATDYATAFDYLTERRCWK